MEALAKLLQGDIIDHWEVASLLPHPPSPLPFLHPPPHGNMQTLPYLGTLVEPNPTV